MSEKIPKFLETKPNRKHDYISVTPRNIKIPSDRAVNNFTRLSVSESSNGIHPDFIKNLLMKIASGQAIISRKEPKSTPGKFRELWIPNDNVYAYLLKSLANIFGTFSTSPEAIGFRKTIGPMKGLRQLIDEYEKGCEEANIAKKKNKYSEGHIIHTCYQGDIQNYFGSITYEQVVKFLRKKLTLLLKTKISEGECIELADLVADLVCPGEVLPQGFATSPAIANGVGVVLDKNIRQGVRAVLDRDQISVVGRYADDLIVASTGEFRAQVLKVINNVLDREGFKLNPEKIEITRALEGKGSSSIDVLGARIRNDGDRPLSFGPNARYVHEVEAAIRYLLAQNLDDSDFVNQQFPRVFGGLNHISQIEYWGKAKGSNLRNQQQTLLPKKLEELWIDLKNRLDEILTQGQKTVFDLNPLQTSSKESKKSTLPEKLESVFKDLTDYKFNIDFEKKTCVITDKNGNNLLELNRESLAAEGVPVEEPEDIEIFLKELEEKLDAETKRIKKELKSSKIKNLNSLQNYPELKNSLYRQYLEFIKWHLCIMLNVLDLSEDQFEFLFDTDEIKIKDRVISENNGNLILPWGIAESFEGFFDSFQGFFNNEQFNIFKNPIKTSIEKGQLFIPEDRQQRRNGRGSFWRFPSFDLETSSGVPIVKAEEEKKKKKFKK
jgi:hypothetical protein